MRTTASPQPGPDRRGTSRRRARARVHVGVGGRIATAQATRGSRRPASPPSALGSGAPRSVPGGRRAVELQSPPGRRGPGDAEGRRPRGRRRETRAAPARRRLASAHSLETTLGPLPASELERRRRSCGSANPVGCGPSSKTWPGVMPAAPAVHLGARREEAAGPTWCPPRCRAASRKRATPVRLSNFVSPRRRAPAHTPAQRKVPLPCSLSKGLVPAALGPDSSRSTRYCFRRERFAPFRVAFGDLVRSAPALAFWPCSDLRLVWDPAYHAAGRGAFGGRLSDRRGR